MGQRRYSDGPWALHGIHETDTPGWLAALYGELTLPFIKQEIIDHVLSSIEQGNHPNVRITGPVADTLSWPPVAPLASKWNGPGAKDSENAIIATFDNSEGGIQVRWAENVFPSVKNAVKHLSAVAGRPIKANMFISGPDGTVVPFPHQDLAPNFFVGIIGTKKVDIASLGYLRYPFVESSNTSHTARDFEYCPSKSVLLRHGSVVSTYWGNPHKFMTVRDAPQRTNSSLAVHLSFSSDVLAWYPSRARLIAEILEVAEKGYISLPPGFSSVRHPIRPDVYSQDVYDVFGETEKLLNGNSPSAVKLRLAGVTEFWENTKEEPWGKGFWKECFATTAPSYPYQGKYRIIGECGVNSLTAGQQIGGLHL